MRRLLPAATMMADTLISGISPVGEIA